VALLLNTSLVPLLLQCTRSKGSIIHMLPRVLRKNKQ